MKQANWFQHPTPKVLLLLTAVFLVSIFMLVAAMTDLFTTPFNFQGKYLVIYLLIMGAASSVIRVYVNYFKMRRTN